MSQPVELYPNGYPVTRSQPTIDSSHTNNSNGSFAHVFIVLAVIAAISVASCVLGRFLSRRHHRVRAENHHTRAVADKQQINHGGLGPREWESRHNKLPSFTNNMRDRTPDIEFGFDKKTASGNKVNDNKENDAVKPPPYDHHRRHHSHDNDHHDDHGHHHQNHFNGKFKPQVRFADDRGNNEEEMSRPVDRRSFNDKFKPQVRFA